MTNFFEAYTIGLDFGTLSGRGILVRCSDGEIVAEAVKEYQHGVINDFLPDGNLKLPEGFALEYPQDYIDVIEYVIPELIKRSNIPSENIIGIGIDFTSCTVFPVDENGNPLCMNPKFATIPDSYAKLWKHHSATNQAQQINVILRDLGLENDFRFGGKCSPELMLPKIMETLQNNPDLYNSADEFLEAGDWLTRMLTGSRKRSNSMAGYKLWWNNEQGYPSENFFTAIDPRLKHLIHEKFPGEIVSAPMGEKIGNLNQEWAQRLGLKSGIAVAPAIIDSHAGVPGCGISSPSSMMLVLGTSSVIVALSSYPFSGNGVMGGVKNAVVPDYCAYESGLACVGDLFAWFIENMIPDKLIKEASENHKNIFSLLNEKAEKFSPGETGLLALDWWNGNKTPFIDAELSGSIVGLTLKTKPEEIYRALIESTAFATRTIIDEFEKHGVNANEIVASGGISFKNPFMLQIYADILGKKISVAGSTQTAALGSAIYASVVAGEEMGGYSSYSEAVSHICPPSLRTYYPNESNHKIYSKIYEIYLEYRDVMGKKYSSIMHKLHKIKNHGNE